MGVALLVWRSLIAVCFLLGVSTATRASDADFFVTANAGRSNAEVDAQREAQFTNGMDPSDSSSSTTWFVSGGYRFSKFFGLSVAQYDFGSVEYSGRSESRRGPPAPGTRTGNISGEIEARGTALAGSINIPLGRRWQLTLEPGVLFSQTSSTTDLSRVTVSGPISLQPSTQPLSHTESANNAEFIIGIGAAFNLSARYAIQIQWTSASNVGTESVRLDMNVLSGGITYRF